MIYVISHQDYDEGCVVGLVEGPNNVDMQQMYKNFLKETKIPQDKISELSYEKYQKECDKKHLLLKKLAKQGIVGWNNAELFLSWLLTKHRKNYKIVNAEYHSFSNS